MFLTGTTDLPGEFRFYHPREDIWSQCKQNQPRTFTFTAQQNEWFFSLSLRQCCVGLEGNSLRAVLRILVCDWSLGCTQHQCLERSPWWKADWKVMERCEVDTDFSNYNIKCSLANKLSHPCGTFTLTYLYDRLKLVVFALEPPYSR